VAVSVLWEIEAVDTTAVIGGMEDLMQQQRREL